MKWAARCLLRLAAFFIGVSPAISSSCRSVEVAGAEGDISGTYTTEDTLYYTKRAGPTSYMLGKYTTSSDQWLLGQAITSLGEAFNKYPHYYTYDANIHPVDVVEAWQLVAGAGNEEEAPSTFSITCTVEPTPSPMPNPTPSPTSPRTPPPTLSPTLSSTLLPSGDSAPFTPGNRTPGTTPPPPFPGVPSPTPIPAGPTPPFPSGEGNICAIDILCPEGKCCNPDNNKCGWASDFCQERSGKKLCCSDAPQESSTTESCFEADICEGKQWYENWWWALLSVFLLPIVGYLYKKRNSDNNKSRQMDFSVGRESI